MIKILSLLCVLLLSTTSAFAAHTKKKAEPAPETEETAPAPVAVAPETHMENHNLMMHSPLPASDMFPGQGSYGLNFAVPTGSGPTIGGTYFLENDRAVEIGFGLDLNKTPATATAASGTVFGFSIDAGYRMYCKRVGSLMPYLQPGLFLAKAAATGGFGANLTVAPNAGIGAEYFFARTFSIGIGTGVALTFKNNFNAIRFATGTSALTGSFYW